jgi:hypothetical protein
MSYRTPPGPWITNNFAPGSTIAIVPVRVSAGHTWPGFAAAFAGAIIKNAQAAKPTVPKIVFTIFHLSI